MGRRWACKVRYEAPLGRNEEPEHPENGPGAENTPETPPVTTRKTQTILIQIILSTPYSTINLNISLRFTSSPLPLCLARRKAYITVAI